MALWPQTWFRDKRAVFGDDATTTTMLAKLQQTGQALGPAGTNDTERTAMAIQAGASQRVDSASRRRLLRAIGRVENAERRHRTANARVDRFEKSSLVVAHKAHEIEEANRAKQKAAKEIDSAAPQIPPLLVDIAEFILVGAEFAFYYHIFSLDLQADAPLLDRVFVAFLAVLVPVVGIMAARFFAGTVQGLRTPPEATTDSRNARLAYFAASALILAVACYATLRLVEWRYKAEDSLNFGQVEQPPSTVMAVVFVALILTDALIRAFLFPPGKRTSIRRRWSARITRWIDSLLLYWESRTLAAWQKRWFSARTLVDQYKNRCDQEQLSATVLVLMTRGDLGGDSSRVARPVGPQVTALPTSGDPYVPHDQLDETDGYLYLPHRVIGRCEDRLVKLMPPEDPKQEQRTSDDDLERPIDVHSVNSESLKSNASRPPEPVTSTNGNSADSMVDDTSSRV